MKNIEAVRYLHQYIGWPSSDVIKIHLTNNRISNSKVNMDDVHIGLKYM